MALEKDPLNFRDMPWISPGHKKIKDLKIRQSHVSLEVNKTLPVHIPVHIRR